MSKLIYVVEDESDILELISLKLKNAGFERSLVLPSESLLV